jgi:hypothetical protein
MPGLNVVVTDRGVGCHVHAGRLLRDAIHMRGSRAVIPPMRAALRPLRRGLPNPRHSAHVDDDDFVEKSMRASLRWSSEVAD